MAGERGFRAVALVWVVVLALAILATSGWTLPEATSATDPGPAGFVGLEHPSASGPRAQSSNFSQAKFGPGTVDSLEYSIHVPLVLGSRRGIYMRGVGDHGNLVCITNYAGDPADLQALRLRADIYQNGRLVEGNVPLQKVDGHYAFEMIDMNYTPGQPVSVALQSVGSGQSPLALGESIPLGDYRHQPEIYPVFGAGDFQDMPLLTLEVHGGHDDVPFWYAKDFGKNITGDENAPGEGIPVYMPHTLNIVLAFWNPPIEDYASNFSIVYQNPWTGYMYWITHVQPGEVLLSAYGAEDAEDFKTKILFYGTNYPPTREEFHIQYDPDRVFAYLGPSDHPNGPPHLHMEAQVPRPDLPGWVTTLPWNESLSYEKNCYHTDTPLGPCLPDCVNFDFRHRYITGSILNPNK